MIVAYRLGLVGIGALIGAGTVYLVFIKHKIENHLNVQSAVIQEIQNDVDGLKASVSGLLRKHNGSEDEEYLTADEDDEEGT